MKTTWKHWERSELREAAEIAVVAIS